MDDASGPHVQFCTEASMQARSDARGWLFCFFLLFVFLSMLKLSVLKCKQGYLKRGKSEEKGKKYCKVYLNEQLI